VIFNLTTAEHNLPSNLTLELYLGSTDPGALLASLGPVSVSGSATANINLVGDNGTLQVNSSTLNLSNFGPQTVAIGALGTFDVSLLNVGLNLAGGPVPVVANAFQINSGTLGSLNINQGSVVLGNPTGTLAFLLPGGTSLNFGTSPISIPFSSLGTGVINGTTDDDGGLSDDGAEVNLQLNNFVEATNLAGIPIYARLLGSVSVGSTPIPEVGTMLMMSLACVGLAGFAGVRKLVRRS
jgi:hypothetical protein